MLQIVYFSRKEQFLTELETHADEVTFVTPSPAKADGLRSRLKGMKAQDVITIAKFTSQLVETLWASSDRPVMKRKAELLLIFGILKDRYLPDLGYEQFVQAYNIFSDMRSFTLNEEALAPVLEEHPEDIRRAVTLFWRLLEATGYLDEHGAYHRITEGLRSSEEHEALKRTWVFWGFQHLNGQQVDLLKALAIRYPVVVPLPLSLKDKLKRGDWPTWLKGFGVEERSLGGEIASPKGQWLLTNSRENSRRLKELLRDGDQVVLGVSKLSPLHIDFVPSDKLSFKIPHQLLAAELREIASELLERFRDDGEAFDLASVLHSFRRPGSLKRLKALQLYEEALAEINALTDEGFQVDPFSLKLLNEVVSLNQPRNSFVPMSPGEQSIVLRDVSALEDLDRSRRTILCVDERFEDVQGLGPSYSEAIQRILSALGPLKRPELELFFRQWEFDDLFAHGEVLVLMAEGTLKHSLVWKRLFANVNLEKVEAPGQGLERKVVDHFQGLPKLSFEGHFSASKFQTFLDCPRKFYFSYVDKVFPTVALEKDIDPMASGTITHRIIEVYHERRLTPKDLPALTDELLNRHIQEKGLSLPRETYLQRRLIFYHRALNGVMFLEKLEDAVGEKIQWRMEVEFDLTDDHRFTGKIDCLGVSASHLFLLDFKSTKFSASSFKEVEDLESVQLWAYARAARLLEAGLEPKSPVLGYVVLDKPVESNLLCADEGRFLRLKEAKLCKQKVFKEDFSQLFSSARKKMIDLALSIRAEKDFPAAPRKTGACHFCELNKVCVKTGVEHV